VPTGTAKETKEKGLDLVIGLVGQDNRQAAASFSDLLEKGKPLLASDGFDRLPSFPGEAGDLRRATDKLQAPSPGQTFDKTRVRSGGGAAQAMIEVADDEATVA
jgi:hypothetical protein